ncbi:MAG TPA: CBS domain-containing protein, partial [Pyrinomonadaceae bacterium]|nr:CBS domain-containing protein [Pyrinomonadaceae bacterium]
NCRFQKAALAILQSAIGNWKSKMFCPSCGYDNIEGVDRCEECMTPLLNLDVPRADSTEGLDRSVMEDKLSQLEQEFLGVPPDTPVGEVIRKMKEAGLGCALVLQNGELAGIFTERDLLNKLTGKSASPQATAVKELMTANPEVLRDSDSVATALNKMSMGRYRHIPVRKADGSYCVTSIKHVLKYIAREEW